MGLRGWTTWQEISDVDEPDGTTTRERWQEILAHFPPDESPEHRRQRSRGDAGYGTVTLAFTDDGKSVERTGRLLNASAAGLMVRQQGKIARGTHVVAKMILADATAVLTGRVVHCTATVGGFKIGIGLSFGDGHN